MSMQEQDFVTDLQNLPDDVVSANDGNIETHRGSAVLDSNSPEAPSGEAAADKPASLRDQISSALKGEATPPAAQIDGGQVRNADGTFAPKPAVDPNAPPPAAPDAAAQGTAQYPQRGIPGLDAATFSTLPAETQQHVARTMESLDQQQAQFATLAQVEAVIAPRRQAWALNGMTDGQVLNQLFALSDFANTRPDEFVRYFADQNGLNLEDIAFGPEPQDPQLEAANRRIQQLEQSVNGFTHQQQQNAHKAIVDEIVAFADEKGTDGTTPLRPYLDELGQAILPFITAEQQQNPNRARKEILTAAYEAACWANPTVRGKMQAAETARTEAKRIADATTAAEKARKAGVSVAPGTPGDGAQAPGGAGNGTLRDTIRASMAAAS